MAASYCHAMACGRDYNVSNLIESDRFMCRSVGNAAKALVTMMNDANGPMATAFRTAGGIPILIELLQLEGLGRKNVAIVIARLAKNPDGMVRGMGRMGCGMGCGMRCGMGDVG